MYAVTLIEAISAGGWTKRETARAVLACLLPFGIFLNDRWLRSKQAMAAGAEG